MSFFQVPVPEVSLALVAWYKENARDLPWRKDVTPYRVWVSEIMLQQTRVEAVKPYFARFLQALPDVQSLAAADDDFLHKLWEGLGYYSRVRNMKKCAVRLVEDFGGVMPSDPAVLKTLPGIGSYTAGAVASIAFGVPAPAVDGNVLRVLSRLCNSHADIAQNAVKKQAEETVLQMIPQTDVSAFTQSLFELGATGCLPGGDVKCENCPVAAWCLAKQNGTAAVLPYHSAKPARKREEHTVFLLRENGRFILRKRPEKGLLAGLWEFPNAGGHLDEKQAIDFARNLGFEPLRVRALPAAVHIFTHKEWHMIGYLLDGTTENPACVTADAKELQSVYALPSAFAVYRDIALGEQTI
ncbi:MAG: A/G-specific adenine glycosylase [Clostridia bacterium]|nr:A/G-specific adenine glycosylase [Clostridia bacterium]